MSNFQNDLILGATASWIKALIRIRRPSSDYNTETRSEAFLWNPNKSPQEPPLTPKLWYKLPRGCGGQRLQCVANLKECFCLLDWWCNCSTLGCLATRPTRHLSGSPNACSKFGLVGGYWVFLTKLVHIMRQGGVALCAMCHLLFSNSPGELHKRRSSVTAGVYTQN